jgi:hypothetical protein
MDKVQNKEEVEKIERKIAEEKQKIEE